MCESFPSLMGRVIVLGLLLQGTTRITIAAAAEPATDPQAASSSKPLSELSLEELGKIVVTSPAKVELSVEEAPGLASIVPAEEIDQYGWISLNDILYKQPGFAASQDFNTRTVGSRGSWEGALNDHLLLLIDGVPHNDSAQGAAYTHEATPLFMTRSVEILRGPASALYGSNAVNGVVQMNTISAKDLGTSVRARARLGNANTQIYDLAATADLPYVAVAIGYNWFRTDGNIYLSPDGSGRTDASGNLQRFQTVDAQKSTYFFAKLEGKGKIDGLSLQFHNQDFEYGSFLGWNLFAPDVPETLRNTHQIITLKYQHDSRKRLVQEYVIKYQWDRYDWRARAFPRGTPGYPAGVWDHLNAPYHLFFLRGQLQYKFWKEAVLLGGVEDTVYWYRGDDANSSNVDLAHPDAMGNFAPFPNNAEQPLPFSQQGIVNRPINYLGVFAELYSGPLLRQKLTVTLGARYDNVSFSYIDVPPTGGPVHHRSFNQFTPRIAFVFTPVRTLRFKLLGGEAFRAPAPFDLFGTNNTSFEVGRPTNKPETAYTVEGVVDWDVIDALTLKVNGFYRRFDNEIGFSPSNFIVQNLISQQFAGAEAEVLLAASWGRSRLNGFLNYSFVHQLTDKTLDPAIQPADRLTWYPAHLGNAGLSFTWRGLGLSAQLHVSGPVDRRPSDRQIAANLVRPERVPAYATVSARAAYRFAPWIELGVQASNLFNTRAFLVKIGDLPFDYRIEGIRVLGTLDLFYAPARSTSAKKTTNAPQNSSG
jgi:outer membrane receptor protein involved in Fe transport